ncbi:Carbamate kinase [hydrothermal vent metagenome]|uniref:Carbamate kinase n=1 Tax=hydrothermal vent metagenome TaxID=652676 RepID=A0A3B0VGE3_9ZZZZ
MAEKGTKKTAKIKQKTIVVSLGGNVIIRRGESGTIEEQFRNTELACRCVAGLVNDGHRVIITHGNGPVVGNILIRNEAAGAEIPSMPLYICDADSEGGLGFMIQQALHNEFVKRHSIKNVVTVVTQVTVDPKDPAFKDPTKPIGPFYTKEQSERLTLEKGWVMLEDSGRGWRRNVASPRPVRIIEADVIKTLTRNNVVVIAAGGGGVPVTEATDGTLAGIDAVIDKDFATATLANQLGAELFINLTQIECAYLDFGKARQKKVSKMTTKEARYYLAEDHFKAGSMRPKIEAAVEFVEESKNRNASVIITTPELIKEAMAGKAGTRVTK